MELEATVDDHLGSDQIAQACWVELAELRPLGQVQHHVSAQQRLLDARDLGEAFARWQPRLRVIDAYVRPRRVQLISDGQRGEFRVSSVPGLNAAPSTAIRLPATLPPA